ncbi:helix-turn-helix domain-containing protein [Brevundimonas nasdae]|uniref:Helix-turn-helix domain-containing protein n=1 Tax=Brevundimonas nasdae TaxID=172043 RepID=A0ABX8TN53_9CAUL|nr:helix-turn-helix domain-containing protein [Brevundimonas nasdae]QYC15904.1 helix-turn-helix domain-containing protein [Brevundimonas nasdae]
MSADIDPTDIAIGARIRTRRETLRITQAQLAAGCAVTFQQVQKYERGVNRVSAARLLQIAAVLKTTGADLLGELENAADDLALATPGAMALLTAFRRIEGGETRDAVLAIVQSLAAADAPALGRIPFDDVRDGPSMVAN